MFYERNNEMTTTTKRQHNEQGTSLILCKREDGSTFVAMQYDPVVRLNMTTDILAIWEVEVDGTVRSVRLIHNSDFDHKEQTYASAAFTVDIRAKGFLNKEYIGMGIQTTSYGSVDADAASQIAALLQEAVRVVAEIDSTQGKVPSHGTLPVALEVDNETHEYLDPEAAAIQIVLADKWDRKNRF